MPDFPNPYLSDVASPHHRALGEAIDTLERAANIRSFEYAIPAIRKARIAFNAMMAEVNKAEPEGEGEGEGESESESLDYAES